MIPFFISEDIYTKIICDYSINICEQRFCGVRKSKRFTLYSQFYAICFKHNFRTVLCCFRKY